MATITPTISDAANDFVLATWAGVTENDTCAVAAISGSGDRTFQVYGTFGGTSIAIHGGLIESQIVALQDAEGDALAFTAAAVKTGLEATHFIQPVRTGGSSTSVTILASARKR